MLPAGKAAAGRIAASQTGIHLGRSSTRHWTTVTMGAAKNKAAKKRKGSPSRGASSGSSKGSGGGFGAPSATDVKSNEGRARREKAEAVAALTSTMAGLDRRGQGSPPPTPAAAEQQSIHGELPDDDFATFPPLSAGTLKSVMGVDVFDMPPGGVTAASEGQQNALPLQVLTV